MLCAWPPHRKEFGSRIKQCPSCLYSLDSDDQRQCSFDALFPIPSLQTKAVGEVLLEEVYKHLGLEETDYFGLQFIDRKQNVVSYKDFVALIELDSV